MSYTITLNGEAETIEGVHNEDFTRAVKIFRLFDDRILYLRPSEYQFLKDNIDFKIRFYFSNTVESNFNPYFLACISGNEELILYLSKISSQSKFNLRLSEKCQFGIAEDISVLEILTKFCNFGDYTGELFRTIESNIKECEFDINDIDAFGVKRYSLTECCNFNMKKILSVF